MAPKTPKFDEVIELILKDLVPHECICNECKQKFKIEKEDITFYKNFKVPPPKECPKCRQIRRFSMLMRVPKFFKRPCNAPGHSEGVITIFPPSSPHKVYDNSFWYSDSWDATLYGRDYDFNRKFFEQFKDLFFDVPHLPLERDVTSLNSEYSLGGRHGKNNYYCAGPFHSEDCSFSEEIRFSKFCVDCLDVWHSEFCYNCICSNHCNRCTYVIESEQCINSAFLYDCKNCINCYFSSNLRNKSFVFENKQLTKEEYQAKISSLNFGDRSIFQDTVSRFNGVLKNALHRSVWQTNVVDCVGDRLNNCNNCFLTFDGIGGENLRFVQSFDLVKDAMDASYYSGGAGRIYESIMTSEDSSVCFSLYVRASVDVEYSSECNNCHDCFGCVGLKNKKFHILNKQYSEEDYWQIVDEIKSKMLVDGEYGELFPLSLGLFPYQTSKGQEIYPIDENEALKRGIPWYQEPESQIPTEIKIRDPYNEVASDIKDVDESILKDAIRCEVTRHPFKIVAEELKFYKHMNLPIPTKHPWQRIKERIFFKHPFELFPFICPNCGEKYLSIYDEEKQKQYKIFCEKCYFKEVI
ncbi:MAG: hypothetical protein WCK10_01100 [Candidatus Staskawiczbacteria bacterium]